MGERGMGLEGGGGFVRGAGEGCSWQGRGGACGPLRVEEGGELVKHACARVRACVRVC